MLTVLLLYGSYFANGQQSFPKGYFRNPLNIPISLSGNFGELRPNHYHMGIDLKTAQRENLPVYAAAEGYISRIKIEPGGFGRAIYITHPNGYTTLYAHLNNFASKIDAYVKQQQYALESWKVELMVPPALLPVKKGDFIAYSGNTGGSQAPHLHFEIRRTEDDVNVNPLLFGMPLKDNVRPRILRFAVYDRTRSVYEQTPKIATARPAAGNYVTSPSVVKIGSPLVSFAITAFDTHTGSSNLNGIYSATLYVNDFEEESFTMNNISYNDTRYLNAHIDYRYKILNNSYLQHLSELPGFLNSIYTNGEGKGVIDISDGNIYDVMVEVKDASGNKSQLKTRVQFDPRVPLAPPVTGKLFYPMMLEGAENENCEFFIGEKCLYDSVHINYRNTASGILIENIYRGATWDWAVVGVGVNINQESFPPDINKAVSFKMITGQHYNPVKLGKSLFSYLLYQFNRLKTAPVEAIMDEYNSYLYRKGEQVKLKKGNIVFSARIDGVSAKGELISTAATQELYNVGEVEFV